MSLPINTEYLVQLKSFIELCNKQPSIINNPELSFLKNFIEKLGGKVPKSDKDDEDTSESFDRESRFETPDPESEESDLELDMTGVIEPDNDPAQPMGDYDLQPTEEQLEQSQDKRSEAVSAFVEKDYEKSIQLYTEAILLNPQGSLLYAKRGQVYLLIKKPNACIRDCNRALELNPDSAAAHKFRGRANQLLGKWEEAANDLRKACKFDFDEQADEWLREVTPNARKIEEHKRKKERRQVERQEHERHERLRKVREAQAKAREQQQEHEQQCPGPDMGAAPGMGAGAGGGPGMAQFAQFLQDPEILMAFQDPGVAEAFKDISSNPSNIFKYQSNPKVMNLINKAAGKFGSGAGLGSFTGGMGGGGGMGGMSGMPGMGGMGGGAAPPPPQQPPKSSGADDFGLD